MTLLKKAKALLFFGIYLLFAGVAGYLSNPEKAQTALLSGGLFGSLSIVLGVLLKRGKNWALKAGLSLSVFLLCVFAWRSTMGWLAVYNGNAEKIFAASLISSMLVAAALCARVLARRN